jgi:hypothetical protein
MPELFKLGGWVMYPILVIGLVTLGAAGFYAARGEARTRGSIDALVACLVAAVVMALSTDLTTVVFHLASEKGPKDTFGILRILCQGFGESLSPVTLGSAFLVLVFALTALGQRKVDARA